MSLMHLQENLQHVYELAIDHNVQDFLITDKQLAQCLDSNPCYENVREKLLIHEDENGLNLSLYLDEDIVSGFEKNNHLDEPEAEGLEDFCLALEGISHFVYLVWNATHERSVTLMEMELQAEVDKFVVLSELSGSLPTGQLRQLLFKSVSYHGELGFAEQQRYREANHYAHEYCKTLESRYLNNGERDLLLNELRRFYRLTQKGKLERINNSH